MARRQEGKPVLCLPTLYVVDAAMATSSQSQTADQKAAQAKAVEDVKAGVIASNSYSKAFNTFLAEWEQKMGQLSEENRFKARIAFDGACGAWSVARRPIPCSTDALKVKLPDKFEIFKTLVVIRVSSPDDAKKVMASYNIPLVARDLVKASWHLFTPGEVGDPRDGFRHANPAGDWLLSLRLQRLWPFLIRVSFTFDLWIGYVNYRYLVEWPGDLDEKVIDVMPCNKRRAWVDK